MRPTKPKLAVWKFASCDGCQLSILDCEEELLSIADAVEIAYFPEATRTVVKGPYDISLVEGSITTSDDAERIHKIRKSSKRLVTIGACAVSGGIQALRHPLQHERVVRSFEPKSHTEQLEQRAEGLQLRRHVLQVRPRIGRHCQCGNQVRHQRVSRGCLRIPA